MEKNCWEFKKCGRQEGGEHVHDLGVCPASTEKKLDGIHGGKNGGRTCWVVVGTLCEGNVQGSYATKYKNCTDCDFYNAVKKTEYPKFTLSAVLLQRLRDAQPTK
jgi:hypothetical protein